MRLRWWRADDPAPVRDTTMSRRDLLRAGSAAAGGVVAAGALGRFASAAPSPTPVTHDPARHGTGGRASQQDPAGHHGHSGGTAGRRVDHARNGFDPTKILYDWDLGTTSTMPDGRTLREYRVIAVDKEIEIAPGLFFPAWTFAGRVPGPTLRCTEGDRIRIEFINGGTHPHTMHFHGIHSARMDGVPGVGAGMIEPGGRTIYEFDAFPFGCHLYHCHAVPLKRHIHKGLYGAFIIDPDPARHADKSDAARRRTLEGAREAGVREMVMVMNAFDTNFDDENEVYAVNTVAFAYAEAPIVVGTEEDVRIYLVNITEFDPINSIHLHANFFDYYDHGTTLEPTLKTVDTIMQCQAQRGILEFNFRGFEPGLYMFHAHQSEFAELGWMGSFDVVEGRPA
ncbi:MAG TPA: multicopper oxidase domain-containing protein [Actinomycetota bacterium]|nr:multicopper oxidase domain-containing protein [Actinomycetota bacterium]